MIFAFPNFGDTALVLSKVFDELGIKYVMPGKNSKAVLKRGAEICPQDMCIPFKYMLGNLMECYEKGADTALMMATAGPCRLGEYGQLFMEILGKNGYDFKWLLLDAPSVIGRGEFLRRVKKALGEDVKKRQVIKILFKGVGFVKRLDEFKKALLLKGGYMKNSHEAVGLLRETEERLFEAEGIDQCVRILKRAKKELKSREMLKGVKPIKILVTGEIYTSMEKDANGYLQEKLMREGCSVKCDLGLWWWMKHTLISALLPEAVQDAFYRNRGIFFNAGGYSRKTMADVLSSGEFDGVIKVMPSGCMPEIVVKSMCEKIQSRQSCKILHLIYDEMSENAGYETRVEAFIDTLERRRDVLAGSGYRLHKYGHGIDR